MMRSRLLTVLFISGWLWLASWAIAPAAEALTSIELSDLSYEPCPEAMEAEGSVSSGTMQPVNCFLVKGKAKNPSGKAVVDADVFGYIYDANENPAMENRGRIGTLEQVPPGTSDFSIRIDVAANQPTPLRLEHFKASGFAGKVRPYYYDDFEY